MAVDPFDQAAAEAFLARLGTNPALTVHDGDVPTGARPPYVLVYFAGGNDPDSNLRAGSTEATMRAYCHCVAESAAGARIIAGQVATTVAAERLTVPGWGSGPVKRELTIPAKRDEAEGVPVMDQVVVYLWRATAA
ncbi:hypothetical protein [Glycomyces tarimensis]